MVDVSLNIKNEHVHDLVRQAAERTGLSQTSVVEEAISQLLRRLDAEQEERRRRVDEILDDMRDLLTDEDRAALSTDFLYDENGLPA
ncbi:antitoxin VapB [Microlunatus flavus]|uniref:Antitoxin VapB n=1 Tax=Microlunatus flavus TaxID=1036181 RepID=A0A1H8Z9W9_9ACTN|nr:antitoxin VapB [Microlunatus flavus]